MPIKEIKHYAELRAAGDSTLSDRMEMLVQHRQILNEQIAQLQEHKIKLDEKKYKATLPLYLPHIGLVLPYPIKSFIIYAFKIEIWGLWAFLRVF